MPTCWRSTNLGAPMPVVSSGVPGSDISSRRRLLGLAGGPVTNEMGDEDDQPGVDSQAGAQIPITSNDRWLSQQMSATTAAAAGKVIRRHLWCGRERCLAAWRRRGCVLTGRCRSRGRVLPPLAAAPHPVSGQAATQMFTPLPFGCTVSSSSQNGRAESSAAGDACAFAEPVVSPCMFNDGTNQQACQACIQPGTAED